MQVFLSHSTADRAFVEKLALRLQTEGFSPWLYEMDIEPQANWVYEMEKGLADADLVLLVWSAAAAGSFATRLEWTSALAREISDRRLRLGIILLENFEPPQLLRTRQHIDARADHENGIAATLRWLEARRSVGRLAGGKAPVYLPDYRPAHFAGREEHLETLREVLVDEPAMFLLSGEPGSGKSTLALAFAWEAQKDFDAVVFQICGRRSAEVIAGELSDKLRDQLGEGIVQRPPQEKLAAVKQWLKQRRCLLVLDDVWLDGVGAPSAALRFADLFPGPPVSVLFTSRRPTLPWLVASQIATVESFSPAEAEAVFRAYLDAQLVERHRDALLQFAARVGRLPIAVTVGAELLRRRFGPLDEAARRLALARLRNEVHDVTGLLERAVEAHTEPEQRLLAAAAVCAPEGFWLPLAIHTAGLSDEDGAVAGENLVNASLLRIVDRDLQRCSMHALLREHLRADASSVHALRQAHAAALDRLFEQWESRWRECSQCLEEVIQAAEFLWAAGETNRQAWLSFWGYECARRIGELDAALRILRQEESFWATRDDREAQNALQRSYGHQAVILQAWGRLEEALALHKKQEAICLELGNQDGLQTSYGNQALILNDWGRLEEALALHKKEEAICLELGNQDGLQASYGNQARILKDWGRLEEALALHKKEEAICLELGNQDGLQASYGNQARILKDWGRLGEALALHKKQEEICLELGNRSGLGYCYWSWGLLARAQGDRKTEKDKLGVALAIFTEVRMPRQRDAVQAQLNA